jgi:AcrR family transcriptional regulator
MEQARRSREKVIEAARGAFLVNGYARTTIAAIASEAGVSAETIYKAFGGKAGLVRAIYERGLAGRDPTPAPERPIRVRSSANGARSPPKYRPSFPPSCCSCERRRQPIPILRGCSKKPTNNG